MRLSPAGESLIKSRESCRLVAYQDSRGRWTIGFGHTGPDVGRGARWTEADAEAAFWHDVAWAEDAVNELVRVALTQNQFDALVSFVFNVGRAAFSTSTLLRRINAGDFSAAQREFRRWNKTTVDGKLTVEPGLTARRAAEAALFALT